VAKELNNRGVDRGSVSKVRSSSARSRPVAALPSGSAPVHSTIPPFLPRWPLCMFAAHQCPPPYPPGTHLRPPPAPPPHPLTVRDGHHLARRRPRGLHARIHRLVR
jgi:hypothetical protein